MMRHIRAVVIPSYLILVLLLGGASAAGFRANMLLQLMAIPIIAWAVLRPTSRLPRATLPMCA